MKSDFEKRLGRLSVRPIPAEWRSEILRAAQAQAEAQPVTSRVPWWHEWFWPNPQAWLGLAAAWVVIFLLQLTSPDTAISTKPVQVNWQSMALLQQKADDFSLSGEAVEPPRANEPAPALRPRTSRSIRMKIG